MDSPCGLACHELSVNISYYWELLWSLDVRWGGNHWVWLTAPSLFAFFQRFRFFLLSSVPRDLISLWHGKCSDPFCLFQDNPCTKNEQPLQSSYSWFPHLIPGCLLNLGSVFSSFLSFSVSTALNSKHKPLSCTVSICLFFSNTHMPHIICRTNQASGTRILGTSRKGSRWYHSCSFRCSVARMSWMLVSEYHMIPLICGI